MALREVQLTGMAQNQTQYEFNSRTKSEPRQVCLAVETRATFIALKTNLYRV